MLISTLCGVQKGDFTKECKKHTKTQFGKLFRACPNAISQSVVISLQYAVSTLKATVTSNPHMNSIDFTLYIWEVICWYNPVDYVLSSDSIGQEIRTTQPLQACSTTKAF